MYGQKGVERAVPPDVHEGPRKRSALTNPNSSAMPEVVIHYAKQVTLRKDAFRYLAEDGFTD